MVKVDPSAATLVLSVNVEHNGEHENVKSRKVIWTSPYFLFFIEFIFLDQSRNIILQRQNKFRTGPEIFRYKRNRNSELIQIFIFTREKQL